MKTRLLQMIIVLMLILVKSFNLDASARETWYNPYTGITIKTQYHTNGMYVKGLYSVNSKNWFQRIKKYRFRDNKGNEFSLVQDKLVYTARRNRAKLTFFTVDSYNQHNPNHNHLGYKNNNEKDFGYLYNNTSKPQSNPNPDQNKNIVVQTEDTPIYVVLPNELEGTWSVKNIAQKVYIAETRDGIKARFTDKLIWTEYKMIPGNGTYQDESGNTYKTDQNNLVWQDTSGQKTFILTKISDDLIE